MGLFVDYMTSFVLKYNSVNGNPTRRQISEWFGSDKKAVWRNGYEEQMSFSKKSAVVVIGVSCIGKSTYAKRLLEAFPDMTFISYDECSYQKVDEMNAGKSVSEARVVELLEEKMLENKDKNLVVDSHVINPASRAALMRFLKDLGYEIFVIYFSRKYTESNISKHLLNRAIELTLYQDYLKSTDTSRMTMKEIMVVRDDIVSYMAKKNKMTEEELLSKTATRSETLSNLLGLNRFYNEELEKNRMWWQELRGMFLLGADYFYEF